MTESAEQLAFWPEFASPAPPPARIRPKVAVAGPRLQPREMDSQRYACLVLASASPSKHEVLRLLGLRFKVDPANIDERTVEADTPEQLVCRLAGLKAASVSLRNPDCLVLGADTLVIGGSGLIGKPAHAREAERILTDLVGRTHRVITGLALVDGSSGRTTIKLATTEVRLRPMSTDAIRRYVQTGEPMGKAGAYALQGMGALLVDSVQGEYTNVLGMPVATFVDALGELGYELL